MSSPELDAWAERWGLMLERPLDGSRYNQVWRVRDRDGQNAVLKVGDPAARTREAIALRHWAEAPAGDVRAVRLLRHESSAVLLDGVEPAAGPITTADLAAAAAWLGATRGVPTGLPHVAELARHLSGQALELHRTLVSTTTRDVVLHGDLHAANLMRDAGGVVVIDPHGWVGDPHLEPARWIADPARRLTTATALAEAEEVAAVTQLDAQRILRWAVVVAHVASAWNQEDHGVALGDSLEFAAALAAELH